MQITFVSNYINHHQIPFSEAMYGRLGDDYRFIQTEPMEEERLRMGWSADPESLPYVKCLYQDEYACRRLITESDVVLMGWTRVQGLLEERLRSGRLTFLVSERLYREGQWKAVSPRGLLRKYKDHTRYRNAPVYLLCAGACVPSDFHLIHAYPGKMLRFGYFPEFLPYTSQQLAAMKGTEGTVQLVWAGRFLPLKHPEFAVRLAEELRACRYEFHIHMVGGGELEEELRESILRKHLQNEITLYGYLAPDEVRKIMERSHIHLFTSNHLEGWGAVVNEAMNSGCAVVANSQAGAVPYLIRHMENGAVYREGSYPDFERLVKYLFNHRDLMRQMGLRAYETVAGEWNAETAADRLLRFSQDWETGRPPQLPERGPLSAAPVIAPSRMYQAVVRRKL